MRYFSIFYQKNKIFLFILIFFFFFSLPLFTEAFSVADIGKYILRGILSLPTLIVGMFLAVLILITSAYVWITGALLDWVCGPNFITFSYTNPASNPIIKAGLEITRSFVSMAILVVLIYIAISVALRLANEEQAKKMLIDLILVALLVNFAPVICGLIVDASNIIMNHFLVGIKEGVSGILYQALSFCKKLASELINFTGDWRDKLGLLASGATQIIVNDIVAITFLMYAGVFLLRYIAIWILVILSPLAFVAWVLPKTKKIWDMWWNQLIAWSIIGIPLAFFLYLGMSLFEKMKEAVLGMGNAQIVVPGMGAEFSSLFDHIIPFVTVVVFLLLGFVIGLKTSAMGADAIITGTIAAGATAARTLTVKPIRETWKTMKGTYREEREEKHHGVVRSALKAFIAPPIKVMKGIVTPATYESAVKGTYRALKDMATEGVLPVKEAVMRTLRFPPRKFIERPTCPKCGNYFPSGAKHCPHCGHTAPVCPKCGEIIDPRAKFCTHCGTNLKV